jgi:hypothetical protein
LSKKLKRFFFQVFCLFFKYVANNVQDVPERQQTIGVGKGKALAV